MLRQTLSLFAVVATLTGATAAFACSTCKMHKGKGASAEPVLTPATAKADPNLKAPTAETRAAMIRMGNAPSAPRGAR